MSNNGKKAKAPDTLKRFTIQADDYLFRMVQSMADNIGVNGYVLVNTFLIMGADNLTQRIKEKGVDSPTTYNLASKRIKVLRDWVKSELNDKLEKPVLW